MLPKMQGLFIYAQAKVCSSLFFTSRILYYISFIIDLIQYEIDTFSYYFGHTGLFKCSSHFKS